LSKYIDKIGKQRQEKKRRRQEEDYHLYHSTPTKKVRLNMVYKNDEIFSEIRTVYVPRRKEYVRVHLNKKKKNISPRNISPRNISPISRNHLMKKNYEYHHNDIKKKNITHQKKNITQVRKNLDNTLNDDQNRTYHNDQDTITDVEKDMDEWLQKTVFAGWNDLGDRLKKNTETLEEHN